MKNFYLRLLPHDKIKVFLIKCAKNIHVLVKTKTFEPWHEKTGVPVYLGPWAAWPPGAKIPAGSLAPGGQNFPGYLGPTLGILAPGGQDKPAGYLGPRGPSCPWVSWPPPETDL